MPVHDHRRSVPVAPPATSINDERARAAALRRRRVQSAVQSSTADVKADPAVQPAVETPPLSASEQLVRKLVEATSKTPPGGSPVLLDTEIDGVRCVLTRKETPIAAQVLSPREQEIARMIAKGLPNKTIAAVLDISSWTVGTYLRRIFAKLGVSSRAAMVAKLSELRLLEASPGPATTPSRSER